MTTKDAVIITLLLGIVFCAIMIDQSLRSAPAEIRPAPAHLEERLLVLDREAIEAAYKQYVITQFLGWMKDETGQPARAARGINEARKAYIDSMGALERRSQQRTRP